jgi:hypothetical protein
MSTDMVFTHRSRNSEIYLGGVPTVVGILNYLASNGWHWRGKQRTDTALRGASASNTSPVTGLQKYIGWKASGLQILQGRPTVDQSHILAGLSFLTSMIINFSRPISGPLR